MKKLLLIFNLAFFLSLSITSKAQTCFGAFGGADINLPCNTLCTPFTATIPEIKSTENYTVASIPYNPYPFVTAAPLMIHPCPTGNQDDKFFATSNLPFSFCFYGTTYNYAIVGSNGVISFNPADALNGNNYVITIAIPFAGSGSQNPGSCPAPSGRNYPRPAIFGLYHDIFPENPTNPTYKIESRIEGTAPCRRFVASFNNVKLYDCQSGPTITFQMVIYEATNIIEVYVKDKPFCSGSNSNPIIGLQRTGSLPDFIAAPGRNLFSQAISNEAWQFKPDGASSLLDHVELVLNGAVVATGTLGALNNGFYDVDFGSVCPPAGINQYVVRGVYKVCNDNPATFYFIEDTVEINRIAPFFANADTTNPLCKGLSTGQVVFNPIGTTGPYEYSINGGVTYVTNNTFTGLVAGVYNFKVRDINGCVKDTAITITEPTLLTALTITSSATCANTDGSIDITAGGGTPAYQYSINNGVTYQPGNVFSNLPSGNYNNIKVKDVNGCITNLSAVVILNDTMRLELGPDSTICFGKTITLIPQTNALTDTFKWAPRVTLNYDTVKNPIATPTDTTKYFLTAKWGVCLRKDSITINVLHKPVVNAGKDTTICYKTNATLFGSTSNLSGTVNYAWSPPDSLNTPHLPQAQTQD